MIYPNIYQQVTVQNQNMKNYRLKNRVEHPLVPVNINYIQLKSKREKKAPSQCLQNRFQQLLRICQTISNKPKKINQSIKAVKYQENNNSLQCTDETIETLLKCRQRGVQSSLSFRLQLPQIKQKQYEQDDSFTKEKSTCLTQRQIRKNGRSKLNDMSTNIKTKSVKSCKSAKSSKLSKSRSKLNCHSNNGQITPFDQNYEKQISSKNKVSIDVRRLLLSSNKNYKEKIKNDVQKKDRKIHSSNGQYYEYVFN